MHNFCPGKKANRPYECITFHFPPQPLPPSPPHPWGIMVVLANMDGAVTENIQYGRKIGSSKTKGYYGYQVSNLCVDCAFHHFLPVFCHEKRILRYGQLSRERFSPLSRLSLIFFWTLIAGVLFF